MLDALLRHIAAHPRLDDLSAHADGRVSGGALRRMEAHLEACGTCREEFEGLVATKGYLSALPEAPLPRSFYSSAVAAGETEPPFWVGWLPGLRISTAAAAVVLVLAIGIEGMPASGRGGAATALGAPAVAPAPEQSSLKATDQSGPVPGAGFSTRSSAGAPATPAASAVEPPNAAPPPAPPPAQPLLGPAAKAAGGLVLLLGLITLTLTVAARTRAR